MFATRKILRDLPRCFFHTASSGSAPFPVKKQPRGACGHPGVVTRMIYFSGDQALFLGLIPDKAGLELGHIAIGAELVFLHIVHQTLLFHPAGSLPQMKVGVIDVAEALHRLRFRAAAFSQIRSPDRRGWRAWGRRAYSARDRCRFRFRKCPHGCTGQRNSRNAGHHIAAAAAARVVDVIISTLTQCRDGHIATGHLKVCGLIIAQLQRNAVSTHALQRGTLRPPGCLPSRSRGCFPAQRCSIQLLLPGTEVSGCFAFTALTMLPLASAR